MTTLPHRAPSRSRALHGPHALNLIRTETVLSRLPIHNLSKKGNVQIQITQKHADGHTELYWQVAPNPAFGIPRQLAYKLDTLVINKKLDELGQPLPKLLRLDSLRQIGKQLGLSGNKVVADLRKAAHQNAGAISLPNCTIRLRMAPSGPWKPASRATASSSRANVSPMGASPTPSISFSTISIGISSIALPLGRWTTITSKRSPGRPTLL